jgi:hypothetical protein
MSYKFYNVKEAPFLIGGILHPGKNHGEFYRLDAKNKASYTKDNAFLAHHTSGATVRFVTDADKVMIKNKLREVIVGMPHFTHRGVWGLDVLVGSGRDRKYCARQMQTFAEHTDLNENEIDLPEGENEILIMLPLYAGIEELEIGLPEGATLKAPPKRTTRPIAFYGASITQGGCASRPGTAFANIICRHFDADCINLGFSGSCFGEQYVAEFMGGLDIGYFVMDYVYNSRTIEELENTHFPFYKTFRKHHPDVPILMCTHPFGARPTTELDLQRIAVVEKSYQKALMEGDKNLYFLDGRCYFPKEMNDLSFVDRLHPNDLGMYFMAKAMIEALEKIIF